MVNLVFIQLPFICYFMCLVFRLSSEKRSLVIPTPILQRFLSCLYDLILWLTALIDIQWSCYSKRKIFCHFFSFLGFTLIFLIVINFVLHRGRLFDAILFYWFLQYVHLSHYMLRFLQLFVYFGSVDFLGNLTQISLIWNDFIIVGVLNVFALGNLNLSLEIDNFVGRRVYNLLCCHDHI